MTILEATQIIKKQGGIILDNNDALSVLDFISNAGGEWDFKVKIGTPEKGKTTLILNQYK